MKIEHDHHSESKHEEVEGADDAFYTFNRYRRELYSLACSPTDPTLVAIGGDNNFGILFKIAQKGPGWAKPLLAEHIVAQSSLAFSYDGQLLASGCYNGVVLVWDASGNLKGTLMGPRSHIKWVRWHPTEHTLLASYVDSNVWMWNADTLAFVKSFAGHGPIVTCGDFTPDGKLVCTGSKDATLRIWKPETGENIHVLRGSGYHTKGLTCLAISSTSALALTGSEDGSAHIVDITRGRVINTLASHSDFIRCVGFAPSNYWAASGGMDQRLVIWDIEHSLPQRTYEHEDAVTCLAWVGSSYVATVCMDGIVRLWDVRSSVCAKTFKGNEHGIKTISLTANGDYLVSGSWDGTAHVFEVLLTTPTTPMNRMKAIVDAAEGFVYLVSSVSDKVQALLQEIKEATNKPVAVGFGISKPKHVKQVVGWGADGVIVGSAIVKLLGEAKTPQEGLKELEKFTLSLKSALP